MNADEEKTREERAFEALIVSQLRSNCGEHLDPEKLPQLSEEERAALESLGKDLIDRLLTETTPLPIRQKPARPPRAERRELVHGLNRADEIDDEANEELRSKRVEALRELEESSRDDNGDTRD